MNKEQLIKKFTSRKFILTAIVNIASIVAIFVGDSEIVQAIAGVAMSAVTLFYLWTEGKIDKASIEQFTSSVANAADKLGADDKVVEAIDKVGDMAEAMVGDENTGDTPEIDTPKTEATDNG